MSNSNFVRRVRKQLSKLGSDLRYKRRTKRVKLFYAGISGLVLLVAIIIIAVVSSGKNSDETLGMDVSPSESGEIADNNSSQNDELNAESSPTEGDNAGDLSDLSATETEAEDTGIYLAEGPDAGEEYIAETLFIGDSNTVRMMNYGITTVDNTIAVVGMGVQSIKTLQCVQFAGYGAPVTMVEAVKLLQPKRIIITFGTNNATGMPTDSFIGQYDSALDAIHDAYPYADIIINSIPPMSQVNKYPKLSQKSIDDFNEALKGLAEKKGYKYLDTASVMKNPSTGFAKDGYTVNDGIHISDSGFAAMFTYIRTHSHIVEDTRPKPLAAIPKQQKATYVIDSSGKMNNDPDAYKQMSEVSKAEQEALKKAQEEALLKAAQEAKAKMDAEANKANCKHENYDVWNEKEPTETETGIRRYKCRNCGYIYDETIPKKQVTSSSSSSVAHTHNFVDKGNTSGGYHVLECDCGEKRQGDAVAQEPPAQPEQPSQPEPEQPETPAHTHDYSNVETIQEPTYDAPGKKRKTCSCGDYVEEEIPKLTPPAPETSETEEQSSDGDA